MSSAARVLVAVLPLLACAPWPGSEPVDQLEASLGGPGAVLELFTTGTDAEIRGALAPHGIQYQVHALGATSIEACPRFFGADDRSTWHALTGEFYFIDSSGRPSRAYSFLPPIAAEARMTTCQTKVGQWGDLEDPGNDFDGGHLLGRWGGRANMVPQDANFNTGTWAALENQMADCRTLPTGTIQGVGQF
jgi:hypothetical protein